MDDPDNPQSIGSRIRLRRSELNLSLRELASQTELTASFLSQLERGQSNASVDSIRRICSALGISLLSLLPEEPLPDTSQSASKLYSPLVRANERPRISFPDIQVTYELFTPDLSRKMEGFFVRLEPGKGNIAHQLREPTEECIFVLSGTLTIELESGRFELNKHDSIYFEGMKLKKLANNSSEEAVWISIITPPVF